MNTRSIVFTSTLVCALATGAHAQRGDAPRSTQQQQAQGLRQASSGRLIIPVTGTLTTPETPTPPTEPTTPPETPPTTPPPTPDPTTPSEPPQTPSAEPPTIPTPTTPGTVADATSQVTGSFSIRRFSQTTTGEVAAVGMLTMSLTDPASGATRTIVTQAVLPVVGASDDSSSPSTPAPVTPTTARSSVALGTDATAAQGCDTLSLTLGSVDLELLGMGVRLDQVNVDFVSRSAGRLGVVLCGATSLIDRGVSPEERMRVLNTLLDAVG